MIPRHIIQAFEGSIYEAANVIRKFKVNNLKVYCNWNGYSAYDYVPLWMLKNLKMLIPEIQIRVTEVEDYGLTGLSAHYVTL